MAAGSVAAVAVGWEGLLERVGEASGSPTILRRTSYDTRRAEARELEAALALGMGKAAAGEMVAGMVRVVAMAEATKAVTVDELVR